MLIEAVKGVVVFDPAQHIESLRAARKHHVNIKEETYQSVLDSILMQITSKRKRAIKRAISGKTSARLSVLPIATCHFDLSPAQFRDGLAVRYMRDLTDLPSKCDGCGAPLTLQHALDCKVGGLVIQRHNEIRDCIGDIAVQVWTQVVREPIVREAETQVGDSGLRLDLGVMVFGNLRQRHYLTSRLLIQMPHPTAIACQKQFLNQELRTKRGFTNKQ